MAKEFHFTVENAKWASWAYLTCSGNQSEHRIHFILSAHRVCHITGLPRSVKSQGETNFFQGQGKVCEFCIWSGKFLSIWILKVFPLNLLNV